MIRPFANGSQLDDWEASNCNKCKNYWESKCSIQDALILAYWNDGTVTQKIADRMGYTPDKYCWMCTEIEWTEEWKDEKLKEAK